MAADLSLLDNPVWNALGSRQRRFALGAGPIRKFPASVLPFMGLAGDDHRLLGGIEPVMLPDEEVYIKEGPLPIPAPWMFISKVSCLQMICPTPPPAEENGTPELHMLTDDDNAELMALVNMVQPGFFREETLLLGDYYGIRHEGRLVAVAGQRMQLPGLTEVSAVCTHPEHTGKGHARVLLRKLCHGIFAAGDQPFLHVAAANTRAISLYDFLGFQTRREISFVKLKYAPPPEA